MPDSTAGSGKFGSISGNRAKISVEEPGVASCRQLMDNGMASVSQLNPYQCDQCGTANIVAAPVLYQQGTHTYSTRFHSGTTQSFSAQAVTPPRVRGLSPAVSCLGTRNCFFHSLDLRRVRLNPQLHRITSIKAELAIRISGSGCHFCLQAWSLVFAKLRATTVRFILNCIGTGSTPIYAGVVDGPA